MGFLKKIAKITSSPFLSPLELLPEKVQSFAYPAIGSLIGGPMGAAAGSSLNTFNDTGSLSKAAISGGGTYAGASIGNALLGDSLGTIGGASNSYGPAAPLVDNFAGNAFSGYAPSVASGIANTSIGSALGSYAGGEYAGNMIAPDAPAPAPAAGFSPSQQAQQDAPASLTALGSLTGEQQTSNLANQGVYGGGLGPQENAYFLNQINRRLVDPSGQTASLDSVSPIEKSYLQQLGLGGYDNTSNLLEAISKWKQA